MFWKGEPKHGEFSVGDWNAVSPWWRDAWKEWLNLRCVPKPNSLRIEQIADWPIWNNHILVRNHGITTPLYNAFMNSHTRAQMSAIRKLGFNTFKCFRGEDGALLSGEELYTRATVSASVHGVDAIISRRACTLLARVIKALWANTKKTGYGTPRTTNLQTN